MRQSIHGGWETNVKMISRHLMYIETRLLGFHSEREITYIVVYNSIHRFTN